MIRGAQNSLYTHQSHCVGTKLKQYLELDIKLIIDKVTELKLALAIPNGQFSAATKYLKYNQEMLQTQTCHQ